MKIYSEVVVRMCSVKKVVLKISQNSQENTCARVSGGCFPVLKYTNCERGDSESNKTCSSKHYKMLRQAEELMERFSKPTTPIPYNFGKTKETRFSKNQGIFKWVIEKLYCMKNGVLHQVGSMKTLLAITTLAIFSLF